jgi:proteic killer suppression protein
VIRSFRSKALRRFAEDGDASRLSVRNKDRVEIMLRQLNVARAPDEMNLPGYFFHVPRGGDKGRYSLRVTGNYRLTFGWKGEDATEVDLEDYH